MGRFSSNRIASTDAISDVVDAAIASADLATNSDLTSGLASKANSSTVSSLASDLSDLETTVGTKADAADLSDLETTVGTKADAADLSALETTVDGKVDLTDFTDLATEISVGPGRALRLDPGNTTGSGGAGTEDDKYRALTLPSGFSLFSGNKYKISGTTLVRTTAGAAIASVSIKDLVVLREAAVAWSDTPGTYNTNDQVLHTVDVGGGTMVQHLFRALQSTTSLNEPSFGGDLFWQDLGGSALTPGVAYFSEIKAAEEVVVAEGNRSTYFTNEADLPSIGYNASTGNLALVFKPKDGQSVRTEFDGTIVAAGPN